jgi:excinuclease ABC subunit A
LTETTSAALAFYATPGVMTDPGEYASLFSDLPYEIPALCRVVQGLLLHPFETGLYDVELTSIQRKEVNIRSVVEMLKRIHSLDDRSLCEARPPAERLVGNCRDHATLLCAMLRYQGVPARVRVGFATYLGSDLNHDHWVDEYWSPQEHRWVMVDPQIDDAQRAFHQITFDTLHLTPRQFITAGQAWLDCRSGEAKSGNFGHNRKARGIGYIRGSLLQEVTALNKVEVLPWDIWWDLGSKSEDALTLEEKSLLDRLAELTTAGNERFLELRAAYEEDQRLYLPVQSRLKLLGLLADGKKGAHPGGDLVLRPSDGARLLAGRENGKKAPKPPVPPLSITLSALSTSLDPAAIVVRGAAQHNLKHIDVTIPRYKLVVLTGISGSGKSSLAFDTLYAEGQRRYVESLSAYVRRYLDQMDKPKVDYIGGLSPAIAIEQKSVSKNPRSTVGTVTEVMDYLRVLFSRAGTQYCPQCGRAVEPLSAQQIADRLACLPAGTRFQLLAPLLRDRKGNPTDLLEAARRDGFTRARLDGSPIDLTEKLPRILKREKHTLELIVDRLIVPEKPADLPDSPSVSLYPRAEFTTRLIDSVETALRAGKGTLIVSTAPLPTTPSPLYRDWERGEGAQGVRGEGGEGAEEFMLTEHNTCPHCEINLPRLTASLFSFNAPSGMCPECNGLGARLDVDPNLIIVNPQLSLLDGASRWHGNIRKKANKWHINHLNILADHYNVDLELPWKDLPEKFRDVILYGSGEEKITFTWDNENENSSWHGESTHPEKGVIFHIKRLFRQTKSEYTKRWYVSFMSQQPCSACGGSRLCAEARYVTVGGRTFPEVLAMTIEQAHAWVVSLLKPANLPGNGSLTGEQLEVVGEVLKELQSRLRFMLNVGLHYLTLDRPAPTLSGGEGQRIRLASQLGCGLVGVLYILDEPSIGLHARDQRNLLETLLRLRDMGNTVLVVEHDAETMRTADWLIDLGPGAGVLGGAVVAAGTPAQVAADPTSLTGRYLSGELQVVAPNGGARRAPRGWLTIFGARLFNLKIIDARFPLGVLTCITGVSGSGKSSLVAETLEPALARLLNGAQTTPGPYDRIEGLEQLDKVINITQDPIGRTPRSNPATYVGVFDDIRRVFASTPAARMRGYQADRFSFNVKGGRCEACRGHGWKRIEMHFLPDVWVVCQECKGARYNRHTLEVTYKGKNIADVLDMDVQEALEFFANHPAIARILQTLHDVGLDYVKLGQSATTLSGGEAQRVKLAKELSRAATGKTIYILDEPTTGLHFADIQRLLDVLHRLVNAGNTVIVIEHNLDVIKTADWIIDLGPEGGAEGGYIIAEGTPEEIVAEKDSYTGRFLRPVLEPSQSLSQDQPAVAAD